MFFLVFSHVVRKSHQKVWDTPYEQKLTSHSSSHIGHRNGLWRKDRKVLQGQLVNCLWRGGTMPSLIISKK